MELTMEQSAANWNRIALFEVLAAFKLIMEQEEIIDEDIQRKVNSMKSLVGAFNSGDFYSLALEVKKAIVPDDFRKTNPYVHAVLKESLKSIKKEGREFAKAYGYSSLMELDEFPITDEEIALVADSIRNMMEFSEVLHKAFTAFEDKEELKLSLGIESHELEKKIKKVDFTLSELRMFCLIVGLLVKYTVTTATGEKEEIIFGEK